MNPCPARWVVPGGKSELCPDNSCALAKMAMEEVKMKAAVTSDLAISSSFLSVWVQISAALRGPTYQ